MKLSILKKYKNKTLQLNLLKLKLYKKKQSSNLNFNSRKIELNLKKILHIIYEYHIKNKKILFLEFPKSFKQELKNTKHILIPNNSFYTDILDNKIINLDNLNTILKNKIIPLNIIKFLLQLNKKVDLIIIYNLSNMYLYDNIIQKSYKSKTPIVYCFNKFNNKMTYQIATTHKSLNEKILNNNFIITMIKITLKKAIIAAKQQYINKKKKKRESKIFFKINKKKRYGKKKFKINKNSKKSYENSPHFDDYTVHKNRLKTPHPLVLYI